MMDPLKRIKIINRQRSLPVPIAGKTARRKGKSTFQKGNTANRGIATIIVSIGML